MNSLPHPMYAYLQGQRDQKTSRVLVSAPQCLILGRHLGGCGNEIKGKITFGCVSVHICMVREFSYKCAVELVSEMLLTLLEKSSKPEFL